MTTKTLSTSAHCPNCKETVCPEELFGQIVCPQCLNELPTVSEVIEVITAKPTAKPVIEDEEPDDIEGGEIDDYAQPLEGLEYYEVYIIKFTEFLYREFGLGADKHWSTVFNNIRNAYHTRPEGKHQITYGWQCTEVVFKYGFTEYKSLRYLIAGKEVVGLRGVHQLALHEFAHVLQTEEPNGRTYGSCHNGVFVKHYVALMEKYPDPLTYEAVQAL